MPKEIHLSLSLFTLLKMENILAGNVATLAYVQEHFCIYYVESTVSIASVASEMTVYQKLLTGHV